MAAVGRAEGGGRGDSRKIQKQSGSQRSIFLYISFVQNRFLGPRETIPTKVSEDESEDMDFDMESD